MNLSGVKNLKNSGKSSSFSLMRLSQFLLFTLISSFSLAKPLFAEEWEVKEGVTVLRYCRGSEVRYSTSPLKDFQLCLAPENKGSFNKITSASNLNYKDFSDDGKAREMSIEEQKQMARDLRAIQKKRDQEEQQEALKELNKFAKSWRSDEKFRRQILQSLSPEEQALVQQFQAVSIEIMKGGK